MLDQEAHPRRSSTDGVASESCWLQEMMERVCVVDEEKEMDLAVMDGWVKGKDVRVLLDSGASRIYVSSLTVERLRLVIKPNKEKEKIVLPNGKHIPVLGQASINLRIGTYTTRLDCRVIELPEFDIILGMEWFRAVNPITDWKSLEFTLKDRNGRTHILRPGDHQRILRDDNGLQESLNLMSFMSVKRAVKKRESEMCLYFIRPFNESGRNPHNDNEPTTVDDDIPKCEDLELRRIIRQYQHIFRSDLPSHPPPERTISHTIDTGDAKPVNINAYPLSPVHIDEQTRQVADLLDKKLIRESSSPWGFPVLFIKKKDGGWRMCIDYQALNAITRRNGYPLPRIQECLDRLSKAHYLTKIDLTSGYWQVKIAEEDVHKTAFNTRHGKFEFLAMPFGLTNAPATFQTIMNTILRPYLDKFVLVYLDDILIYSETLDDHREHVATILETLSTNNLYAKPSKCVFLQEQLKFCGHIVGGGQVLPTPGKLDIIREWPIPRTVHEVRQFLGLESYYRRFVRHFATIAGPLFDLLKEDNPVARKQKHRKIIWNASCDGAFTTLKTALTSDPVLLQPDVASAFTIETDASDFAIGCVLLQRSTKDQRLHPVAFDGRRLTPAEFNYPVHEKELLAIKHALRTWRYYIDNGLTTTVVTDHESLKYLKTTKTPSKRLARWISEFSEFDLDIQYRRGEDNVVADAVSRRPDFICLIQQEKDPRWITGIIEYLKSHTLPEDLHIQQVIMTHKDKFFLQDDQLFRIIDDNGHAPYIDVLFRADLLERMHGEYGHLGLPGLDGVLRYRAWWPGMEKDVKKFIAACPNCQTAQRQKPKQETETPRHMASRTIQPFDRWAIDLIGKLPVTPDGNCWIITAIDYATGWPVAKAVPDAKQETIADFLHDEIFCHYGPPKELLSDNGANLLAPVVSHYLRKLSTRHRMTTPYHPRTNGKVENLNGTLGSMLTKYLMGKPTKLWDQYLVQALFACRIRVHATTKFSPFYLLYGRHPTLPSDDNPPRPLDMPVDNADERIGRLQHARLQANESTYQRALNATRVRDILVKPHEFKKGDYVLVRHEGPQKFEAKWYGPYMVDECMPLGTYRLCDPAGKPLVHLINGQRLARAHINGDVTALWTSPFMKSGLRRANMEVLPPSDEERRILDAEEPMPPPYEELATAEKIAKRPSLTKKIDANRQASTASIRRRSALTRPITTAKQTSVGLNMVVEGVSSALSQGARDTRL